MATQVDSDRRVALSTTNKEKKVNFNLTATIISQISNTKEELSFTLL